MRKLLQMPCGLFTALLILLSVMLNANALANNNFTLVQSVPLATNLRAPAVPSTQPIWLSMINGAQRSINLGSFYFTDQQGEALTPVVQALRAAARRGVKERIIIDSSLLSASQSSIDELQGEPNIQFRILPLQFITGGIMHAKYIVVDGHDVYVGSANFDWRSLMHVHELGVRVQNSMLAAQILRAFNYDWQMAGWGFVRASSWLLWYLHQEFLQLPIYANYFGEQLQIKAYFSPPTLLPYGLDWELPALINLLDHAQQQILLQVLTFSPGPIYGHRKPWLELYNALQHAAARGVKVRIILANWELKKKPSLPYLKALNALPNVQIKISYIPKYKNQDIPFARVEHLKYVAVDNDKVWIGTGNWEWSYFYTTRNISLIIAGAHPNQILRKLFWHDWYGKYVKQFKI